MARFEQESMDLKLRVHIRFVCLEVTNTTTTGERQCMSVRFDLERFVLIAGCSTYSGSGMLHLITIRVV